MCTLFLVVAFCDTRFLSGLSHRFSYIVQVVLSVRASKSLQWSQHGSLPAVLMSRSAYATSFALCRMTNGGCTYSSFTPASAHGCTVNCDHTVVPLCSRSYTHLYTHLRRLYTDVYTYQIGSLYQSQQCVYISRCTKILIPFGTTQADLVYAFSFKRCKMSIHIVSISNECVYTIHCSVTSWALILSTACAPRHPPHEMTPLCAIEPWLIWWWFLKEIYMYMDYEIPA